MLIVLENLRSLRDDHRLEGFRTANVLMQCCPDGAIIQFSRIVEARCGSHAAERLKKTHIGKDEAVYLVAFQHDCECRTFANPST